MENFTSSWIQTDLLSLGASQVKGLMPYFWMIVGTLVALMACLFKERLSNLLVFSLTLITLVVGFMTSWGLVWTESVPIFNAMMVSDSFSHLMNLVFISAAGITVLGSWAYLKKEGLTYPEYYVLLLFSTIGMMLMVSAQDLIVLFIALELMSLTVYTLVAFRRADRRCNEASLKYFVLGGAASAILLYGAALIYGATGSTQLPTILSMVQIDAGQVSTVFMVGAWLVIAGFLFKVASVPFHMWMPDVYEGAPMPITGFMTTGLKAASFAAFARVFISLGYGQGLSDYLQVHIHDLMWICALLTMIIGNLIALTQTNLKRMLAYSSIAHTGYLMVGMIAGAFNDHGYSPVIFYLMTYSIMNIGAFILLAMISKRFDVGANLQDFSGLAKRHPWLAFSFSVFMLSMAGIPPTAGFVAKYLLFYAAVQAGEVVLVILSVLCSAISVYYYLRVILVMYMKESITPSMEGVPASGLSELSSTSSGSGVGVALSSIRETPFAVVAVGLMVILTIQLGVLPQQWIEIAKQAVSSL